MADPDWREFELLIARIEQWLGPKGAEVKSPDKLPDRVTGELREVDASIRFRVGSAPVLVTVECRDRTKVQDVRWIEEIASKRDSVGAARTIAVSSSGFTDPARKKAKALGIELRTTNEITEGVAAQWARNVKIAFVLICWNLISLELRAEGAPPGNAASGSFPPDVAAAFQKNPPDAQIGVDRRSNKPLTVRSVVDYAIGQLPDFTGNLGPGNPPLRKIINLRFQPGAFRFFTEKGERDLQEMNVTVDVWLTCESAPPPKVVRYDSIESTILEVAQTEFKVEPDRKLTLLYSQTPPADAPDPPNTDDQPKPGLGC